MEFQFISHIRNVLSFQEGIGEIQDRRRGSPAFGVIYSEPGLGKTEATIYETAKTSSPYLRANTNWSPFWMMGDIIESLGEAPQKSTQGRFKQIKNHLEKNPSKILFIDELEHLAHSRKLMETLRDIHDETGIAIVFASNIHAERLLARYPALTSRIVFRLEFKALSQKDIKTVLSSYFPQVRFSDSTLRAISNRTRGNFRYLDKQVNRIDQLVTLKNLTEINPEHIGEEK